MSLRGQRIIVTRARSQALELIELLEARGASVIVVPSIEIAPPLDVAPLDAALAAAASYDAVIFSSRNCVEMTLARGFDLKTAHIGTVGAKTAAFLEENGLSPAFVPPSFRAEALGELLLERLGPSLARRRFLLPRAPEGREVLIDLLRGAGAEVDAIEAYRIVRAPPASPDQIAALSSATAAVFLSGRTLECFLEVVPEAIARETLQRCVVAVIGPVAAEAAQKCGVRVDVVPEKATIEALIEALDHRLQS